MLTSTENSDHPENKLLDLITNSNGRSHSFIFSGTKGIGKSEVTKQTAYKLLETTDLTTHPNILWIDAEEKNISVAEIRNISSFMYRTTYHNELPKLIVIDCADNLNIHSLNALLKLLEEPTKNTYFILISNSLEALPDTIKSRCVIVNLSPPDLVKTRKIIKQQLPELSDDQLDEYLSISHAPRTIVELANNNVLKIYKELLEFLCEKNKASAKLHSFIEKNFSTLEQLELFQILTKSLLYKAIKTGLLRHNQQVLDPRIPTFAKASVDKREDDEGEREDDKEKCKNENKVIEMMTAKKNTRQLLEIDQKIDSLVANSKTLGLDVRGVILISMHKLMK
jgi:DNA polymerase III delta prime subunit